MQNITYVVHTIYEDCLGVMTSLVLYKHTVFKRAY